VIEHKHVLTSSDMMHCKDRMNVDLCRAMQSSGPDLYTDLSTLARVCLKFGAQSYQADSSPTCLSSTCSGTAHA
jgi:hypothetical protein